MNRIPANLLDKHPVDVVVIDDSWGDRDVQDRISDTAPWLGMIRRAGPAHRPKAIVQILSPDLILSLVGRKSKCQRKALEQLGYAQHSKMVDNCLVGGAVDQKKLVIVYVVRTSGLDTDLLSGVSWGAVRETAPVMNPCDDNSDTNMRKPWGAHRSEAAESTPSGGAFANTRKPWDAVRDDVTDSIPFGGAVETNKPWGSVHDDVTGTPTGGSLYSNRPTVMARPMSNLLRPFGIPYKAFGRNQDKPLHAPNAQYEPMPPWAGSILDSYEQRYTSPSL